METIQVNTSQHVDIDYPAAGLGERVAARLIDLGGFAIMAIVILLLGIFTGVSHYPIAGKVIWITYGLSYAFYNLICEIFMNGQSFGKKLIKIKVISIDGSRPSMGQYFIRWLFRLVDFVLTAQVGGLICIAASDKKQRVGDMVAGTTLIKTVPRTGFEQIAFHPTEEEYIPVFTAATQLTDRDAELIHEVLTTFYKTNNPDLIHSMSARIATHFSIAVPPGMNGLDFLKTIIKDYNYITSRTE